MAAQATVVYQFSLEANGAVGPVEIRWTVADFIQENGLVAVGLLDPGVSFSSGTPLDAAQSIFGFDQDATESLFGIALVDASTGGWCCSRATTLTTSSGSRAHSTKRALSPPRPAWSRAS